MSERVYIGRCGGGKCTVHVRRGGPERPLDPRLDLRRHSPTGFAWGYNGSGPAQLALALLADCLEDPDFALACYQVFKREVVALFDEDVDWTLCESVIWDWFATYAQRMRARSGVREFFRPEGEVR